MYSIKINEITVTIISSGKESFGLAVFRDGIEFRKYHSVSRDIKKITAFAEKINKGNLSPLHIDSVIEDFMTENSDDL